MTREEINKFLADTKVYVAGKSEEIQKKLFLLGYKWCGGQAKVDHTDAPFLYINKTHYMSHGRDMCIFTEHGHREISAEEILALEITEPSFEEKFDPTTLKSFDKVITKCGGYPWKCNIFSYYIKEKNGSVICCCMSEDYIYDICIPYNDDTKHLVGTNKEAPEYYRYWEE